MARLRKCKLVWAASETDDIAGYKLYWARGGTVDYHCDAVTVGNVTEIEIPACVNLSNGPVMFGITAFDSEGNESDMTTLAEPFSRQAPLPPQGFCLEPTDGYIVRQDPEGEEIEPAVIQRLIEQLEEDTLADLDDADYGGRHESDERPAHFDIGSIF